MAKASEIKKKLVLKIKNGEDVKKYAKAFIDSGLFSKGGLQPTAVDQDDLIDFLSKALSNAPKEQDGAIMKARLFIKGVFKPKKFEDSILTAVKTAEEAENNVLAGALVELCDKLPGAEKVKGSIPVAPQMPEDTQKSTETETETKGSGNEKTKLEKKLKDLENEVKIAKGLSDVGKKASEKYDEAKTLLEADNLADAKLAISEVNVFLRKSEKVAEVIERVSDLKAEVNQVLKNNAQSEVGLQAKAKLDQASKGLKGEDPNLDAIEKQLLDVGSLLENNDEDDDEPLIDPKELKVLLAKTAKANGSKSFPFACCVDSTGFHFTMHKRKKSASLGKNLKRDTGCSPAKLSFGDATADKKAKIIQLNISEKSSDFPKLFKLMKLWLKNNKPLPVKKARIMLNGNEIAPSSEEIIELLQNYAARVLTVKSNNLMFANEVDNVWNSVLAKAGEAPDFSDLDDNNVGEVMGLLANVDTLLDNLEGNKDWLPVSKEVGQLYTTAFNLIKDNKPDYWDKLTVAWTKAKESAESYDFDNAHTIAAKVKSTLLGIVEGSLTGGDDAQTRWEKASSNWNSTINKVLEQIDKFKQELMKLEDAGLKEIAQFELDDLFLDYTFRVTKAFSNVNNLAGSPEKQANLAGDALDLVVAFKKHMLDNDKIKIVERFGASAFDAPTSVQVPLTEAFNELQPALVLLRGVAA